MKRLIIDDEALKVASEELLDGELVEIQLANGDIVKKTVKKMSELFDAEIKRLFVHQPNSFEWGKAGNRHKVYYYSKEDGEKKIAAAKELEKLAGGDEK